MNCIPLLSPELSSLNSHGQTCLGKVKKQGWRVDKDGMRGEWNMNFPNTYYDNAEIILRKKSFSIIDFSKFIPHRKITRMHGEGGNINLWEQRSHHWLPVGKWNLNTLSVFTSILLCLAFSFVRAWKQATLHSLTLLIWSWPTFRGYLLYYTCPSFTFLNCTKIYITNFVIITIFRYNVQWH